LSSFVVRTHFDSSGYSYTQFNLFQSILFGEIIVFSLV